MENRVRNRIEGSDKNDGGRKCLKSFCYRLLPPKKEVFTKGQMCVNIGIWLAGVLWVA